MRELPDLPTHQLGAFTTCHALASGWSRSALAHAVATGRLVRLRSGVYVAAGALPDDGPAVREQRLALATVAALAALPTARASHASAAALAGLPPWYVPELPCLTVPPRFTGDSVRAHLHRARVPAGHLATAAEQRSTSATRMVVDLAREHGRLTAAVVGDAALARGLTDHARLAACLDDCRGWPGLRRARAVVAELDARSESPLESVSRLRLSDLELPCPDLQPEIFSAGGAFIGRVDFYWDEFGVVGEADGRSKYDGQPPGALWKEKVRQEQLEDTGLVVVRWGRPDLDDLRRLEARLRRAYARGAARSRSDRRWIVRRCPVVPAA